MPISFSELWEKCENFYQESKLITNSENLLEELAIKTNLYKAINTNDKLSEIEVQQAKSRILGEILLTLTGLSLKDNINVYEALSIALQYRSADFASRQRKS